MITYEDFAKVEIKAGKILSAEKIPDTDKLLKLKVDFGTTMVEIESPAPVIVEGGGTLPSVPTAVLAKKEMKEVPDVRQIVSGIALYFPDPAVLVGKKCMFVTNLEPRTIKGHESNGMLFALSTSDGAFSLLEPSENIPVGTKAK